MAEIELQGLRIAYERVGSGPPVVLVHGFVGDGRSTWGRQIDALSDDYTVLAWDAPGAGRSSDPPDWFRISDYADCLAGLLRELGVERAHLAGLSFGGTLVLATFQRHRHLARSLGLVNAYAGWAGSLGRDEARARLQACLRAADLPPDGFAAALMPSMFSASAPEAAVAGFGASVREFSPAGFRAMSRASAEADLRDVLPEVDVPTLIVHGDQDVRAPRAVAAALHARIPGSRLAVLPGVGHMSTVEAPDAVTRELRIFFRSADERGGRGLDR
ncbi:alpha/beta fold hydrolase [Mumia sp. DW29H23]|uniref:alpha/beta fold hydrolase n=1 Tax=Mumia sp. DW29H23 TaxID=3421241 RepID=UPI003D69EFAC